MLSMRNEWEERELEQWREDNRADLGSLLSNPVEVDERADREAREEYYKRLADRDEEVPCGITSDEIELNALWNQ